MLGAFGLFAVSNYRDVGLFAFLALAWGGSFVAIETGLESLPPVFFAAIRYDLGAVLLVGYAAATADKWVPIGRDDLIAVAIVGAFIIAINNALLFVGQQYTTSGVAAILYSLVPVLTTGFARGLLPEERLSKLGIVGLVLGLVGVTLIVRPNLGSLSSGETGKLLVVMSAVSVSLGSVLVRRTNPVTGSTARTGWAMALGAMLMHGASLGLGEAPRVLSAFNPQALVALLYLAVFATAAGYATYFGLLERHGPIQINLVSYAAPMVAALAGWILLDESLAPVTVLGFVVILTGFALIKREALASLASPR